MYLHNQIIFMNFLRRFKKNTLLLYFMLFSVNGIIVVVGVSEETQEYELTTIY